MSFRKSKSSREWFMYQNLHDDVSRLLKKDDLHFDFHENDLTKICIKKYDITIMSRFICRNPACDSNEWSSKKIVITIRMYFEAQYNARVYNQRCQKCNKLNKPRLNDSYAKKVTYRLKKWCEIEMNWPTYLSQSKDFHQSDLCEECKHGHCSQLRPK